MVLSVVSRRTTDAFLLRLNRGPFLLWCALRWVREWKSKEMIYFEWIVALGVIVVYMLLGYALGVVDYSHESGRANVI